MDNSIIIRKATQDDLPIIADIYNYAILNTTATFDTNPKSLEDRNNWFNDHSDEYPLLVAVVDGKVVGWGDIHPLGDRKAYQYTVENAVYIDCNYQGKGLGSAILEALISCAKDNGYHAMIALIVKGNEASVRVHQKFGFEQLGVMREIGYKFDQWLDLMILEKIL